jgi:hypothetical protein
MEYGSDLFVSLFSLNYAINAFPRHRRLEAQVIRLTLSLADVSRLSPDDEARFADRRAGKGHVVSHVVPYKTLSNGKGADSSNEHQWHTNSFLTLSQFHRVYGHNSFRFKQIPLVFAGCVVSMIRVRKVTGGSSPSQCVSWI